MDGFDPKNYHGCRDYESFADIADVIITKIVSMLYCFMS